MCGRAEKRLSEEIGAVRCGDKADGGKTVFNGKTFGLKQCFTRNGGNMRRVTVWRNIKGKRIHRIGCRAIQRLCGSVQAGGVIHPSSIDAEVFDLLVRDNQLGGKRRVTAGRPGSAQIR